MFQRLSSRGDSMEERVKLLVLTRALLAGKGT